MIFQLARGDDTFILCSKAGTDTLSINFREIFTFDKQGRLVSAMIDDTHYFRGLNNRMVRIHEQYDIGGTVPIRTTAELIEEQAEEVVRHIGRQIARVEDDPNFQPTVRQALSYSYERLKEDAAWFRSLFGEIPVLPPDRYRALVVKATEGCSYNRCSFCTLYQGINFKMRSKEEFDQHVRDIKDYFGAGLTRWTSIFMGDANALSIPQHDLIRMMDALHREFPEQAQNGMYCFADTFASCRRRDTEYLQLARKGLKRVYIGLESGCQDLLEWVQKPVTPEGVGQLIQELKTAGIHAGIMIVAGLGGKKYAAEHTASTIEFVNSLNLGSEDFVYLSPLVIEPASGYAQELARGTIHSLSSAEISAQLELFKQYIHRSDQGYPKTAIYDLTRFIY